MDVVANLPTDDLVSFLVPPSLTLSTVAARLCGDLGLPQSAQRHVLLEDAVTGTRLSDWETPLESLCACAVVVWLRVAPRDIA